MRINTFITTFILMPLSLYGAGPKLCHSIAEKVSATKIDISGEITLDDKQLLMETSQKLLESVSKNLFTPSRVEFYVGEVSPSYDYGTIMARFPFFIDTSEGNRLYKSANASLGLQLHELVHSIFETHLKKVFEESDPEVLWAFFTRMDMKTEGLTKELINRTRSRTRYKDKSTSEIIDHFYKFASLAESYNELFADTLPSLFLRNPDAIYDSLHFQEVEIKGDSYEKESQAEHRFRRFARKHSLDEINSLQSQTSYIVLATTKNFIWDKAYRKIIESNAKQEVVGVVAEKIINAIVASFKDVTQNFTTTAPISIEVMNANLQMHLAAEFKSFSNEPL